MQWRRTLLNSWVGKILWRRNRLPAPVFLDFPCGSAGKESACNAGDLGSIPGLGRSPEEGKGYLLQYSDLENIMDCISPWGPEDSDNFHWATFTFKVTAWWVDIYTHCEMITTIKSTNTSSISHSFLCVYAWWKHLKSTLLPNFKHTIQYCYL